MTFTACIRKHSVVWKNWHTRTRTGGVLNGVIFHWHPGDWYRSDVLSHEQIILMREHRDVILEMTGIEVEVSEQDEPVLTDIAPTAKPHWKPPERFVKQARK